MVLEYITIFVSFFISTASILIPIPAFVSLPVLTTSYNPILLSIVASLGAAFGELVGYGVGKGGLALYKKKNKLPKWFSTLEKSMKKHFHNMESMFIIIIFAATPLPFDFIGILAGSLNYDVKKFFIATFVGKIILHILIIYGFIFVSTGLF